MACKEKRMSVVVVVPTYNERENILILIDKVLENLPDARVLIVDDNSPDGTGQIADDLAAKMPDNVSVMHRTQKQGLGAAYVAGYQYAMEHFPEATHFVQMDADLSHDPTYLPALVEMASTEADVAVGSRYTNGVSIVNWPLRRLIISKMGTAYARLMTRMPITDCTGGYKCYRREVLEAIDLPKIRSNGYCFQIETSFRAWQKGYRLRDVHIIFYERQRGSSKLNLDIAFEALMVTTRLGLERIFSPTQKRPAS